MEILVFLLGVLLGFTFGEVWVWVTDKWGVKPVIKGYHLHHTLLAIPIFFTILFTPKIIADILLGMGVGVIIQHTYKEGFKFISKE